MNLFEAVILGLVQGLTEFLPISSSAHLRLVGLVLPSHSDPGATFTAITQIGTELAVLVYFWTTIVRVIKRWFLSLFGKVARNDPDARMGWLVIFGSLPIAVLGFLAQDWIRNTFRNLWIVAIVLIVFGILLGVADRFGKRSRELADLTYRDGVSFGFAQALALVPGVSRSGATTTLGLALGYSRSAAAEYSFLLAVPAVFGSGFYELYHALKEEGFSRFSLVETGAATFVAFGIGLFVITFLMRYLKKGSFLPFVVYRVALGAALIVLLSLNLVPAT